MNISKSIWNRIPATSLLSSLLPPKIRHLTVCQNNSCPFLPDHIPELQLLLDSLHMTSCSNRQHLSNQVWSSAPSFFPFRAYCCPSGEVINGFIMYESIIPSVCCLVWIAHISSSFMPSMLTVRRYDKAVPSSDFSLTIHKTVYQDYVSQRHKEDRRRNPFILYRKEANGLKSW